jgi:enediyne biosynthesis protein E4
MEKKLILLILVLVSLCPIIFSQDAPKGGVSTGVAKSYSSRRTVGITDQKAPNWFEDVTARTALSSFRNQSGSSKKDYILEVSSGSVAIFDYDNDGLVDVYMLNGSTLEALAGKARHPKAALYKNLGGWKFQDVTEKAGVANERWGMGIAAGDYNNDGYMDIYVSNYGTSRLYRNNGNGTFTDVAEKLGVARKGWSTGATWGDYDRDGRLDLFVPGYVDFDLSKLPPKPEQAENSGQNFCQFRGVSVLCGPRGLKGEGDTLYHQKADGTFEDVSVKSGTHDPQKYYGFSSAFVRINEDDLLDLVVVNDSTPKQLYINKGDGTFEELGYQSGLALNETGREQAGMGLALGDYDNDGLMDVYITNFSDDSNTLYHNDGDSNFTDVTVLSGHGEPTYPFLGWGAAFLDFDNDCWKDLLIANGHVYPEVDKHQWGTSYAQQPLLFKNNGNQKFERVAAHPRSALAVASPGRGMAIGDLDNDGRVDAVINSIDSSPLVIRNVTDTKNNWISLNLKANTQKGSPRDATGTSVYITVGKMKQRVDVISGGNYASQNDRRVHIGIGSNTTVDKIEIKWPDGSVETVNAPVNRISNIVQGRGLE